MSWRTNPAGIPNNARDFAEKIDALGLKGLSLKERAPREKGRAGDQRILS
jgi:hypothetical protein